MDLAPAVLQLLWIDAASKAAIGLVLALFPGITARLFGLPPAGESFWPRMLGATLLGLAIATVLEAYLTSRNGLGLAGLVAINLTGAMGLVSLLIMGRAGTARRGRALLWLLAAGHAVLALVELAWA